MIDARILLIGAGGLGSPAASVLARSGVRHLTLVDDDAVTEDNLHRQTLYGSEHVGLLKGEVAAEALLNEAKRNGHTLTVDVRVARFLPTNAIELSESHDVIVEGSDNFATKFMAADAAHITNVPIVQAGAVRWSGWALGSTRDGACLRCVFEDIPRDRVETCAEAGVVGPVVGVLGALQASIAIRLAFGRQVGGELWHYEAMAGTLRMRTVRRRPDCPLCNGEIEDLRGDRYSAACAA